MLRFTEIRAQAWLGSWLQVLPAVRSFGGPGVASHAVFTAAAQGWAASLQQAIADLAAEGVYLDQAGGVSDSPPAAPWLWEDGAPALEKRQRLLSRRRAEAARARLLGTQEPAQRARFRACGGPGAGAWLLAAPTAAATRLLDVEFKIAARLRLGVPLFLGGRQPAQQRCRNQRPGGPGEAPDARECTGECGKPLDAGGFHALTCLVGGLVLRRHHSLRDALAAVGREAGFTSGTEVYEPRWTRARQNAEGQWEVEQARLDCRFDGPPPPTRSPTGTWW